MTDGSQAPPLTLEARIQIASTGGSLRQWYRLRRLWNEMKSPNGDAAGELEKLASAIEASFAAAAEEAEAVAAAFEAHAEQINAMLAEEEGRIGATESVGRYFGAQGSDDARRIAERLRELPSCRQRERDSLRGRLGEEKGEPVPVLEATAFCSIAEYMFVSAYAECENGSASACGQAMEYLNDLLVHCPL